MARYLPRRGSRGGGRRPPSGGGRGGRGGGRYGGDDYYDDYGYGPPARGSRYGSGAKHEQASLLIFIGIAALILIGVIVTFAAGKSCSPIPEKTREEVKQEQRNEVEKEAHRIYHSAMSWIRANPYEDKEDKIAKLQPLLDPRYSGTKWQEMARQEIAKLQQLRR